MAHTLPENIKLTHQYNKLIRTGKSNKSLADFKASRDRSVWTAIDGKILDKPIQVYRMWYRFLQLSLELEEVKYINLDKNISIEKCWFETTSNSSSVLIVNCQNKINT